MARNEDLKVLYESGLIEQGLVKGGVDKQAVAAEIGKFRDKGDKKGLADYIENLKKERVPANTVDPEAVKALADMVKDLQSQITALKGGGATSGGNK